MIQLFEFMRIAKKILGDCQFMLRQSWLIRLSYLYLALPFVLFCFGWYKLPVSLAVLAVLIWVLYRIFRSQKAEADDSQAVDRTFIIGVVVLGLWVLFSGLGGYAFQNVDLHWRNAIFHDLINYNWPVFYPSESAVGLTGSSQPRELVYYIGYWLPSALVGKLFGWNMANLCMFIWTCLGVFLVTTQIAHRLKASLLYGALLLIFFSGTDALGVILISSRTPLRYPALWPAVQQLEWWSYQFQYSSFTTQLYWVFNQALPCWVGLALLINSVNRRHVFFLWSLCLFFSPLPALGMIPFVALEVIQPHWDISNDSSPFWRKIWGVIKPPLFRVLDMFTLENVIGGGLVILLSMLYFRNNQMAQVTRIRGYSIDGDIVYILFTIFEWGLLWLILFFQQRKNIYWYLIGLFLALAPFIQIGNSQDFAMRATIPALFYMMVICGESLRKSKGLPFAVLLTCLMIGAITPLCEINRSVYRTFTYYTCNGTTLFQPCPYQGIPKTDENVPFVDEADHIRSLVADNIKSLVNFPTTDIANFASIPNYSFPENLLLKKPIISMK